MKGSQIHISALLGHSTVQCFRSAVRIRMYELCIQIILKALKLIKTETEALRPELTARMVKTYPYIKQEHKAQQYLSVLDTGHPEQSHRTTPDNNLSLS